MKTRSHISSVFVMIVLVFMCVVGSFTSAWFTSSPSNTNVVVVLSEYNVTILGNSTVGSATYTTDLTTAGFDLPTSITPGGSYTQHLDIKNNDSSAVYVRATVYVRANGVDVTSSNYISINYSSTYWTKTNQQYTSKSSIASGGTLALCTTISFASNIPEGQLIQIVVVLEAKSTTY